MDDLLLSLDKRNEMVTFLPQKGRGKAFSLLPARTGVGLLSSFQREGVLFKEKREGEERRPAPFPSKEKKSNHSISFFKVQNP